MPIAVIAVSMLVMLVVTTPSEASLSCMSKTEARQHFGSVHIYWHGKDHCWDATPTSRHHQIQKVQRKFDLHTAQRKIDQPNWHDAMSEMLPNEEPVRSPWVDRWIDIEQSPIVSRWVDIAPVAPSRIIRKPEPMVTPRGVVMVIITIILTIAVVEVLFSGMINERMHKRPHRGFAR